MSQKTKSWNETVLESVDEIESSIRSASKMIYHSTPLTDYRDGPQLDLRDIVVAGQSAGRNVLLNGSTGIAKTHLSKACLAGAYGSDNSAMLQVDPSLTEEKLFDLDGKALQEGRLSEAIKDTKLITAPGVLLDEVNRAPQAMLNILQAYLNNQALTPAGGSPRQVGIELPGLGTYQFKMGTCNEGKKYDEGTFKMDPAFRRRWPIEVPMDLFRPTSYDMEKRMNSAFTGTGLYVPKCEGNLEKILDVHTGLGKIGFDPLAKEFIAYLGRMNNCVKSQYKTKTVQGFDVSKYCPGCHGLGLAGSDKNLCGNVYAPSAPQEDIIAVARGFALVRAHHYAAESGKMPKEIQVTLDDVIQAFPFIVATKLGLDPAWVEKYYERSGEPFQVAKDVGINIEQRIGYKLKKLPALMFKSNYTKDEKKQIDTYTETDPWGFGLRDSDLSPAKEYTRLKKE